MIQSMPMSHHSFPPFSRPLRGRWIPDEMLHASELSHETPAAAIEPRYCLMINPFYPKDANASFGKHVLTPTLALTSFAATTPEHWRLKYWDENLLAGVHRAGLCPSSWRSRCTSRLQSAHLNWPIGIASAAAR